MQSVRQVQLPGISLRVKTQGDPGAMPVVLVHGVGARLDNWSGVASRLEKQFHVVSFDLRGHGQSGKPHEVYTIEGFAADLLNLLDELGIARCHIAGHSLGGMIGQKFAISYPERVARLAILSSACGRTEDEKKAVAARVATIANGIEGTHFRASVDRWFTPQFIANNAELIDAYAANNALNDPACYASAYNVLASTDLIDEIAAIKAPTLIATGEFDRGSSPSMARAMHGRIAGSKLTIIPELRHSILVEAPELVATMLAEFFSASEN
jgi:pimeloyl-ACP methyl ester carboxylesterase